MCTSAYDVGKGVEISSMGDIRKITDFIIWNGENGSELGDEYCLCWVDVAHTLLSAGYKVWLNPDALPYFLCEEV